MAQGVTSGSWSWNPSLAEFILDAYARIQIYAPAIEDYHIIEARRSSNLILLDFGNRGVNLWEVDQITLPLQPLTTTYTLPANTLNLLDVYLRVFPSGVAFTLGNPLTAMTTAAGDPMLEATGEPMLVGQQSGVFSTIAGSQVATMHWPSHGLAAGSPIPLTMPTTIGPETLTGTLVVSNVVDQNNIQFITSASALKTLVGTGGTPLFVTKTGSSTVTVVLSGHGYSIGQTFPVTMLTAVGGLSLAGNYVIGSLPNPLYSFTFDAGTVATANAVAFENGGRIEVMMIPAQSTQFVDTLLWPISRNDYAALPIKNSPGRPSIFWFNRTTPPQVNIWPVPPVGSNYGFVAYRTRDVMDANPLRGQTLDTPRRFYSAFVAELAAYLAEKYRPAQYQAKVAAALMMWERAAMEDREKVSSYIVPALQSYYR
jgi:hypothetical protein